MTDPIPWALQRRIVRVVLPPYAVLVVIAWLYRPVVHTAHLPDHRAVDAIFVIDDSASMIDEQVALAQHTAALVAAVGADVELRVAVLTTSTSTSTSTPQQLRFSSASDPELPGTFQVGTAGDPEERGLDVVTGALAASRAGDGAALRADAAVFVALFTDEVDHSAGAGPDLRHRWQALVGERPLSYLAVTTPEAWSFNAAQAQLLGGHAIDMTSTWSGVVVDVARDIVTVAWTIALPVGLVPGTVQVSVDDGTRQVQLPSSSFSLQPDGLAVAVLEPVHTGAVVRVEGRRDPLALFRRAAVVWWSARFAVEQAWFAVWHQAMLWRIAHA